MIGSQYRPSTTGVLVFVGALFCASPIMAQASAGKPSAGQAQEAPTQRTRFLEALKDQDAILREVLKDVPQMPSSDQVIQMPTITPDRPYVDWVEEWGRYNDAMEKIVKAKQLRLSEVEADAGIKTRLLELKQVEIAVAQALAASINGPSPAGLPAGIDAAALNGSLPNPDASPSASGQARAEPQDGRGNAPSGVGLSMPMVRRIFAMDGVYQAQLVERGRRFVVGEGDALTGGMTVAGIAPDGVLVDLNGRLVPLPIAP